MLNNSAGGLFLDPGMGKTSTTLKALKTLLAAKEIKGVLLVAPIKVIHSTWPEEVAKWDQFKDVTYTLLYGPKKEKLLKDSSKDIYLINPEGIPWLLSVLYKRVRAGKEPPFDCLVVDESTKFKNPRDKTKEKKRTRFGSLVRMLPLFKRRYILTGTPMPKNYMDLWSQIFILDSGAALGKRFWTDFRKKYFMHRPGNDYEYVLREGADEKIQQKIRHLVLEMSAKDYLKLPDIIFSDIYVELSPTVKKQYKTLERELFIDLDGDTKEVADSAAIAVLKCQQVANGRLYENPPEEATEEQKRIFIRDRKAIRIHSKKAEALADLIDELGGKPLLIAYSFKHDKEAILEKVGVFPELTSNSPQSLQDAWNRGEIPAMLCNPAGVSHGLNLQKGGAHICWFSLTWNLEHYLQFNARLHRQGAKSTIHVYHLVARDTVDQAMLLRLTKRDYAQRSFRDALKSYQRKANV